MEYEELKELQIHYVSCPDLCNQDTCTRINNDVFEKYAKKFDLEDNIKFFDVEEVRKEEKLEAIVKADIIIFDPCNRNYFLEIKNILNKKSSDTIFYVLTTFCETGFKEQATDLGYEFVCLPKNYNDFFSELNKLVENKNYLKDLKN